MFSFDCIIVLLPATAPNQTNLYEEKQQKMKTAMANEYILPKSSKQTLLLSLSQRDWLLLLFAYC